jgi:hypothetical protein
MESPMGQVQLMNLFTAWGNALDAILESMVTKSNPTLEWYLMQRGNYQGIQRAASIQLAQLPESFSEELKHVLAKKAKLVAVDVPATSGAQYRKIVE